MRYFPGIEETSTSTGTTTLTLTEVAGRGRFSDSFKSGEVCAYSIEDSTDNELEFGFGTVASNVLTRVTALVTLDAGIYDLQTPAFINVQNEVTIRCTNINVEQGQPAIPSDATDQYIISHSVPTIANRSVTANRIYYVKFFLKQSGEYTGMVASVTTAQGGGTFRMGIYSIDSDGNPGIKLDQTGSGALDSTVDVEVAFDGGALYLSAGAYYTALISTTGGGFQAYSHNDDFMLFAGFNGLTNPNNCLYEAGAGIVLPDPANAVTQLNLDAMMVGLYQ